MRAVILAIACALQAQALIPRRAHVGLRSALRPVARPVTTSLYESSGDAPGDFDVKEKLISDLMLATNTRDEDMLVDAIQNALSKGLPQDTPQLMKARQTYQEVVTGISGDMRSRLMREAQSGGADSSVGWNPGYTYLGIFAVVSILVVVAGKGIFY